MTSQTCTDGLPDSAQGNNPPLRASIPAVLQGTSTPKPVHRRPSLPQPLSVC